MTHPSAPDPVCSSSEATRQTASPAQTTAHQESGSLCFSPIGVKNTPTLPSRDAGEEPNGTKLFLWFFLGLLSFSFFLLYGMLRPFIDTIILACVITAIAYPFYNKCVNFLGGRKVPAAIVVLLVMLFLVILPIFIFVSGLVPQAAQSIAAVNSWLAEGHLTDTINESLGPVLTWIQQKFPQVDLEALEIRGSILEASRNIGKTLISTGTHLLGNTLLFFAHLLLIMLIMFFLLIDGAGMVQRLAYLCPLKPEQTRGIIESMRRMSRAVLMGGFCVAAIQGIVGGLGLAFVGIPALFWGTVMAFAALVPVVGTGLVWIPAAGFLLLMGEWKSALFLAIWCGVGVSSIDSFLRPIMMRGGAKVPILFLFLSILGGVNAFGMLGLLYGPMILGLVAVMLEIYSEEYKEILQSRIQRIE